MAKWCFFLAMIIFLSFGNLEIGKKKSIFYSSSANTVEELFKVFLLCLLLYVVLRVHGEIKKIIPAKTTKKNHVFTHEKNIEKLSWKKEKKSCRPKICIWGGKNHVFSNEKKKIDSNHLDKRNLNKLKDS